MEQKCPQCGAPLPSGGLAGLCPACLLAQAANETAQPGAAGFVPPTVEELAALFPQLEIRSLIGRGGMGAVYQARQPALDRIVALKILPARADAGPDFAERFNREARALAKLNHPNIVTVHEFGQVRGMPFFIMEYVDGLNLRQLEQAGKLSPREALQIVPQICEALQFAHDNGIVHRDIKPDNILVDKKGRVKIADFGIAKILGTAPETGVPETQGAIGTPNYMAPEQIERPQSVDHRADIFSLGVVFYEMLTGELPLGKFAPPSSGPRGLRVDVRLDDVVLRALEKEPDRRYQHASQVKTAVETISNTPPGAPPGAGGLGGLAAPVPSGPTPEVLLARDYTLDIGACLRRGWALMKAHFWELLGIHALMALLIIIADSVLARLSTIGSQASGEVLSDGTSVVGLLLTGPLLAGLYLYFLKTIRGEATTVETAFAGFSKRFLHLFLVNLVMGLLVTLGFFCLILPGIYLLVAWSFSLVLVMDKGLEFWPAMELSRKMVNKHWWQVFGFVLVLAGVWLLGLLACCIGVLVSAPVALAVFLYGYEDIFGTALPAPPAKPLGPQPLPPPPVGGPAAAKPAAPAAPPNPPNPLSPPNPPNPPGPSGPAGPVGPTGTIVMPNAPVTPPPSGGGRFLKFVFAGIAGVLLLLLLAFLFRMFELHRLGGGPVICALGGLSFFLALLLLALGLLVAVTGGGGRLLKYALGAMAGVFLLLIAAAAMAVVAHHHAVSRVFPVRLAYPSAPMVPLPPSVAPPAPSLPAPPGQPGQAEISPTEAYDNFVVRTRQELDKFSVRFDTLQLSSTNDTHLLITFSGLQELRFADGANAWRDIVGSIAGVKTQGEKWVLEGQDALSVVRFAIAGLDFQKFLAEASLHTNQPATTVGATPAESSHADFAARLAAAEAFPFSETKDRTLGALARDAARVGDVEIVQSALNYSPVASFNEHDAAVHDSVLLLVKVGMRRQAIDIASRTFWSNWNLRDQTLKELAQ